MYFDFLTVKKAVTLHCQIKRNMDNDYLNEIDDVEIPDELSYLFIQLGIQKKVMRKWKALKRHIAENTQTDEEINEFEKLLNYFYNE